MRKEEIPSDLLKFVSLTTLGVAGAGLLSLFCDPHLIIQRVPECWRQAVISLFNHSNEKEEALALAKKIPDENADDTAQFMTGAIEVGKGKRRYLRDKIHGKPHLKAFEGLKAAANIYSRK